MRAIHGVPKHYPWGDATAIPSILDVPADGRPWAEWWLGTHPEGPALLDDGRPLVEESGELPYMLKLLAAAQPLSLQTHPDEQQATAGFNREDREGIALGDPKRLYRDRNAKPELLCALSPFDALCGFRPIPATLSLLRELGLESLAATVSSEGLRETVARLYRGHIECGAIIDECAQQHSPAAELVTRLAQQYPGDPSVVVTLLLNRVQLQPGEAIFLDAGNLHAYLSGVGVEVMGASDNVIRGGLTSKVVDAEELLRILNFKVLEDPVVSPVEARHGEWHYPTPDAPFEFWRFDVADAITFTATTRELLLCTDGNSDQVPRGAAAYIAPGETVELNGRSTVFCVTEQSAHPLGP